MRRLQRDQNTLRARHAIDGCDGFVVRGRQVAGAFRIHQRRVLRTDFPSTLLWGPEYALVYNRAYVEMIADKHPAALGRPAQ